MQIRQQLHTSQLVFILIYLVINKSSVQSAVDRSKSYKVFQDKLTIKKYETKFNMQEALSLHMNCKNRHR